MGDWRVYSWLSTDFHLFHQTNSKVKMKESTEARYLPLVHRHVSGLKVNESNSLERQD